MRNNVKLWLASIVIAVLLVGGAYGVGSLVGQAGAQPAPAQTDPMERIAAALERIATAMEKSASSPMSGMMGGMMQGMGQMDMMGTMAKMMEQCQEMMQGMQGMMGTPMAGRAPAGQPTPTPSAPAQTAAPTEADLARTSQGAGITVTVTFMNPLLTPEETAGKLVFKVALDTHTGDLSQLDLTKLAVLRTSEGAVVNQGFTWEPLSESSHHRLGLLKLEATFQGAPLITKDTKYIELELQEIGVPSRLFKWEGGYLTSSQG